MAKTNWKIGSEMKKMKWINVLFFDTNVKWILYWVFILKKFVFKGVERFGKNVDSIIRANTKIYIFKHDLNFNWEKDIF